MISGHISSGDEVLIAHATEIRWMCMRACENNRPIKNAEIHASIVRDEESA